MNDHPILGVVLVAVGAVLLGLASHTHTSLQPQIFTALGAANSNEALSYLALGLIVAANGALLVVLGSRKLKRARQQTGEVKTPRNPRAFGRGRTAAPRHRSANWLT
jgi:uncharacterized metal-binding protein